MPVAIAAVLIAALSAFSALGYGESLEGSDGGGARVAATLAPSATPGVPVAVFIDAGHGGRRVPAGFLGLSFELTGLDQVARYASGGNLVGLLRSLGRGVLRFGGVSADTRVAWSDAATPAPAWASSLMTPADMRSLATFAMSSL